MPDRTVSTAAAPSSATSPTPVSFPVGAPADYQLGGPHPPAAEVEIVVRDRTAAPVPRRFNVCYVNGFQAQPDATSWWLQNHPELVLRDDGEPVVDRDWDELLFDISTPGRRAALAKIVGGWVAGCARDGFQGVELDNLDSWTRSRELLDADDALAFAALLTRRAHGEGLVVAHKNAAELTDRRSVVGFDFAVAEECEVYSECEVYTSAYGRAVIEIEYTKNAFRAACRARGDQISVLLRDREVVPAGHPDYVNRRCE